MSLQETQKGSLPIVIGVLVVAAIAGGVWYYNAGSEAEKMTDMGEDMMRDGQMMVEEGEKMMEEGESMMKDGEAMMEKDDAMMMEESAGTYEEYSAEKVASADGDVVLFFHAKWCPTCRALDSQISNNLSDIPSDVTILKVDYDSATDLRQQYGVTVQHTLVQVDSSGNLVSKWTGSSSLDSVVSQIR